jgi:hypothetical protein
MCSACAVTDIVQPPVQVSAAATTRLSSDDAGSPRDCLIEPGANAHGAMRGRAAIGVIGSRVPPGHRDGIRYDTGSTCTSLFTELAM